MTKLLRSSLAAVLAVFCLTVSAHAQAAIPGEPGSGVFSSLQVTAGDMEVHAAGSQWSASAFLPKPKKYNAVTAYNDKVYSFGGYTVSGTSLLVDADSYVFDPAVGTYSPIADFPSTTATHFLAFTVGDKIYIMGGAQYNGAAQDYRGVSTVYEYDPAADSYTEKASMPITQFYCAGGVIDGKIYLIGGRNDLTINQPTATLNLVQVYDPATDTWDTATDYPQKVMYLGYATVDNQIVVAGGFNYTFSPSRYIADTWIGKVESGTLSWEQAADYPVGSIIYPCGTGFDGKAFFTGGRPAAFGNAEATDRTYMLDVATDTWTAQESKPTGMQNNEIAYAAGVVVVAGGELAGRNATTATEIFDPNVDVDVATSMADTEVMITATSATGQMRGKYVTLVNEGPSEATWSVEVNGDSPWISFDTESGMVEGFNKQPIAIIVDPAKMQSGENVGSVNVNTDDPNNPTYTIDVYGYLTDGVITTDRNVLVEEFSGTWCGWCPDGVDTLKALEQRFGERINVITYHNGTHDPMVTSAGNQVMSYLGVGSYPSASIDRFLFEGEDGIPISRSLWAPGIRSILDNQEGTVSIEVKNKAYQEDTKQMDLTVEVTFLQAAKGDYRLHLVQTTNQRNFAQTDYTPSTHLAYPYMHDHVVMNVLPNAQGAQLGDGNVIMPGTKFTQDFSWTSLDSIPALSDLTFFVYNRISLQQSGAVMQSHSELLMNNVVSVQDPMVAGTFALEQNYPNPFNPATTIRYNVPSTSQVKLVVTDVLGREVQTLVDDMKNEGTHTVVFDASRLQSGTYFVTMTSGSFVDTKSMTLMK